MKAEIIFTGTELLLGQILNTNALYLQQSLAAQGIDLYFQVTVGDNLERLKEAISQAAGRSDLVIVGGGLGPTEDDLSREALSGAIGSPLVENSEARAITERFFKSRGIDMPANNLRQALAPQGSIILDNPVGTAPGLAVEKDSVLYVLVPGPPNEFMEMVKNKVIPLLREKSGPRASIIKSRVLKLCGIGESRVDEIVAPLLGSKNPTLAPTAKFYEIHLRITSKATDSREADRMNGEMERKVRELLGEYIYGTDEETLPEAVGKMIGAKNLTLALAEIGTGGYLSHLITSSPHCRQYFKFAVISGAENMEELLGIRISRPEDAAAMLSTAVREKAGADIGIALAGEENSPCAPNRQMVVATSFKEKTLLKEIQLPGGEMVDLRHRSAQFCLVLLWHTLKKI